MNDKNLDKYLKSSAPQIPDDDFTEQVMSRLPRRDYSPVIVWAIRLTALLVAVSVGIFCFPLPVIRWSLLTSLQGAWFFPTASLLVAAITLFLCRRSNLI